MQAFPFPDRIASRDELKRDILYNKIPHGHLDEISDRAWDTGVNAARSLIAEYGKGLSINEIARASGLTIERIEKDNISGNIRYFSEYYSGPNKIFLYSDSIKKWAQFNKISFKEAEELILSHEYFHFLECKKLGLTSKQYTVPNIRIGSIVIVKSGIRALSEIGAHGFSRTFYELCGNIEASKAANCKAVLKNYAVNAIAFDGKQTTERIFSKGIFKLFNRKNVGGWK